MPCSAITRPSATAGLIGTIVKKNASISGAEVGCQGEVGVACAMAAGAAAQLFGQSPFQIEYAAEMALGETAGREEHAAIHGEMGRTYHRMRP